MQLKKETYLIIWDIFQEIISDKIKLKTLDLLNFHFR